MRIRIMLQLLGISITSLIQAQCLQGNCQNGSGIYKLRNGAVYQGEFTQGLFNGNGSMTFPSNDKYVGPFLRGKKHGTGKYIFAAGHQFIGNFTQDQREGKGKMLYANGDVYLGEWSNDLPNGNGRYTFGDASYYEGPFLNGNFNGNGRFVESNGEGFDGTWVNNVLQTKQEKQKPQENNVVNNTANPNQKVKNCTNQYCDNEIGRFDYRDGSYYIGEFAKGEAEGEGHTTYANGDIYKGGWKSHGPHGYGIMTKADRSVFSGLWEMGVLKKRSYENDALAKINNQKKENTKSFNENVDVYAVIVGVATYNHMSSLRYTDDDAYHLYAFLKSPEGGAIPDEHISILIDDAATKKNIAREIGNIFSKADANDVVLLYMSGHGLEGAFVPSDFDGQNNLLEYTHILSLLEASPAKHKLYVTDACHSGSMYASKTPYNMALTDFYTKIKTSKGGTAIITSSKKDEVSLEYSGMRHGVFSHYLIQGLKGDANKNADNYVTIQELFDYIYIQVRNHTNNTQTPSIHGDYDQNMPVGLIR